MPNSTVLAIKKKCPQTDKEKKAPVFNYYGVTLQQYQDKSVGNIVVYENFDK